MNRFSDVELASIKVLCSFRDDDSRTQNEKLFISMPAGPASRREAEKEKQYAQANAFLQAIQERALMSRNTAALKTR